MSTLPERTSETPPEITPKRYFRRGKISAYRDQFMLADGKLLDGERLNNIERLIDYIDARWYDADTGEELRDLQLARELEVKYQQGRK